METWLIIVIFWGAVTVLVLLCSLQSALRHRVRESHRRAENTARALAASEGRRERRQRDIINRDRPVPPPYARVARAGERPVSSAIHQAGRRNSFNSFRASFYSTTTARPVAADGDDDAGTDHSVAAASPPLPPPAARLPPAYVRHQPGERPPLYEPPQRWEQPDPASYFAEAARARNHDWSARQDSFARDRFWRAMDQGPVSNSWTRDGGFYPWIDVRRARPRPRDVELGEL